MSTRRDLDETAVRRVARRLAAAEPPWLHGEVARRMAERLPMILRQPETIVEWSAHLGASGALLTAAYPKARRAIVEPTPELQARSAQAVQVSWWSMRRLRGRPLPDAWPEGEVPGGHAQLLWSNLLLHAVADPPALLARWKRALADDGFLMFSTFGPATLQELGSLYRELGWAAPLAPFVDMHDLGDMLVESGFADPVMDQEQLLLSWRDGESLLRELRALGGNVHRARLPGLRTPRWRQRLLEALAARRDAQGRISMTFEIVYGHAFNAPPRVRVQGQAEVGLDDFRRMVGTKRRSPPSLI